MLDANEIAPNLWQGSLPLRGEDLSNFDVIVFMAKEVQPPGDWYTGRLRIVRAPIDDNPYAGISSTDMLKIRGAVKEVVDALRAGKRVLVTCFAGLNRSGVVVALVLRVLFGLPPYEAIRLVREGRGEAALGNEAFVELIMQAKITGRM